MTFMRTSLLLLLTTLASMVSAAEWKPAEGPLMTRWAKDVSPENVHREYPRPQLVREDWKNLNGLWQYAVRPREDARPEEFDGQILVPFPVESALSGVNKRVGEENRLWYRRTFQVPKQWSDKRLLLHFGAVDWDTTVWVNGKQVETHRGGYDPFSFDVTEALKPSGEQELVLSAFDPSDAGYQARGKQVRKPGGIFYTPTTGIWQTVWIEPVPQAYVRSLKMVPDVDAKQLRVIVNTNIDAGQEYRAEVAILDGDREVARATPAPGVEVQIPIPDPHLWTPDDPFLYGVRVTLRRAGGSEVLDRVTSYTGMRKISLGKDSKGITRIMLNNQPMFMYGPLDQGFWPDGLYTAPTDEALRYDIEMTKQLGFNMARKHVKVEPARWYYWCDKLGLLVWQDMPSGDRSIGPNQPDIRRSAESAEQFEQELKAMIDTHRNAPSIVMWVVFNEGWGQYDTARLTQWTKDYDPSRLVTGASGWVDRGVGDVHDIHSYPGPDSPQPEPDRAAVLGEFGGLGLPVENHTWQPKENWGYRSFTDSQSLTDAYCGLLSKLHPLVGDPGLSAAVYTQTTDVETEVNGLMTYDRALVKMDEGRITQANRRLYLAPPTFKTIVPTSAAEAHEWRYTTEKPADDWYRANFDDSQWKTGPAGFGTEGTPGTTVRTEWKSSDIWIRRSIEIPEGSLHEPQLLMHHDEDAEVYLNGILAARATGYTTRYVPMAIASAAAQSLKPGKNQIAIHCKQTGGGQYIDAGIVDRIPSEEERAQSSANAGEWQSMFDGKTLTGWKETPFAGHNEVKVEDGRIILLYGSEMTGITWTGDLPRMNYEVSLEAMRVDGTDFFCGLTFPVNADPCSLIVGGWGGGVVGLSSLDGRDASENETTKYREFKKGQWYRIRLRVTPGKVEAWIDDDKMVEADVSDRRISIRSEVDLSKPLGIASYSTTAALRNIKIRRLIGDTK